MSGAVDGYGGGSCGCIGGEDGEIGIWGRSSLLTGRLAFTGYIERGEYH